jgi:dTDP-4-amino-4,6-dideoxygalactose transaminase
LPIPFADLGRDHHAIATELRDAFERVVGSSDFVLGRELEAFESEFAEYIGVAHCVGVASGTSALSLALEALEIREGHEVIVPAHTFAASALAVIHAGARPVFCDVDAATGLVDLDSAANAVGERTAAIMPVHLYGQVCDMDALAEFADRHGLAIVEDAAQAHGASWRGRRAGAFGAASAFSFYPSKNLGALGDGGAICTNDAELAERARHLRNLGQRRKNEHVIAGYNERLDTMQAAFLRVKLGQLDAWNERRRAAADRYRDRLPPSARTLPVRDEAVDVYHLLPIRSQGRDELARALSHEGIATGIHYFPAVPDQPLFADVSGYFPAAAAWAREELSLPIFPGIEAGEIDRVCAAVTARLPA